MFVNAHKKIEKFTRSVKSVYRTFDSIVAKPGSATAIIVNDEGWLLTCKHVGELLINQDRICKQYEDYKLELEAINNRSDLKSKGKKLLIRKLKSKYHYKDDSIIQVNHRINNWIIGNIISFEWHKHPKYDIMLIKPNFNGTVSCDSFPTFYDGEPLVGRTLCKTGFPFAEFNNIEYDKSTDSVKWTNDGNAASTYFALNGIITRRYGDDCGIHSFEMGTPGIKGQSGGPVFDKDGFIYGIQSQTRHLDLDFKSTKKRTENGKVKSFEENAFMYVGIAISSKIIMKFMDQHKCKYIKSQ